MASAPMSHYITPEEYLAIERAAAFKSEYCDGRMDPMEQSFRMMAGARRRHNRISGNLYTELHLQLKNAPCEAYISAMRVKAGEADLYTYPDIVIVCGEPETLDLELDTILNPTVIIEILSPSTESWDRGGKFAKFQKLESMSDYILVTQHLARTEHHVRLGDQWMLKTSNGLDDSLRIDSIGCVVSLRDIYARVTFD